MLAQLLFVGVFVLSGYMAWRVVDSGAGGRVSRWHFKRNGRLAELQQMDMNESRLEVKISVPQLKMMEVFESVVAEVPTEPNGGINLASQKYQEWLNKARFACLQRAKETLMVYRSCDEMYRDTYCKFTQGQASNKAWQDAVAKREGLERELSDICEWAGQLYPGWERGIIPQASQELEQEMQEHMRAQRGQQGGGASGGGGGGAAAAAGKSTAPTPEQIKAEERRRQKIQEDLIRAEETELKKQQAAAGAAAGKKKKGGKA